MKKKETGRLTILGRKPIVVAVGVLLVLALALAVVLHRFDTARTGTGEELEQDTETAMAEEGIEPILEATALRAGYEPATPEQVRAATKAFQRLLEEGTFPELMRELEDLGFLVQERQVVGGRSPLFVREAPERATGKGFYMIADEGTPVLLQAPHRYKDVGTGTIVARLMEEHGFKAAAWNTVPRWYDEGTTTVDADLAHIEVSHFNAFTVAFAVAFPEGRIVQIHGFARDKRTTASGRLAGIIVSSGTRRSTSVARALARCLDANLAADTVLLYPTQVRELGGTTNTNGQALRAAGFEHFVHVELSREIRDRLLVDRDLRARFAESITQC